MKLTYQDVKVIGFNGSPLDGCGRALPIAHHELENIYFQLPLSDRDEVAPERLYTGEEVNNLNRLGRVTLFPRSVEAPPHAMVFYITQTFLYAGRWDEPKVLEPAFEWQELNVEKLKDRVWAACATQSAVERVMNRAGLKLMGIATAALSFFVSASNEQESDEIEQVIKMALYAARSKSLRASIFLRYGLLLTLSDRPERLDNLYELFLSRQFPDWTWEAFHKRLEHFANIMRIRTMAVRNGESQGVRPSAKDSTFYVFEGDVAMVDSRMIDEYAKRVLDDIDRINKIPDVSKQREEGQIAALSYRDLAPSSSIDRVAHAMTKDDGSITLDNESILAVATEASTYVSGVITTSKNQRADRAEKKVRIDTVRFAESVTASYDAERALVGPLGEQVLAQAAGAGK